MLIAYLIFGVLFAFACGAIASGKNRDVMGWALCGLVFGIIGLIVIAVMPELEDAEV
jgi:hypothetical protein